MHTLWFQKLFNGDHSTLTNLDFDYRVICMMIPCSGLCSGAPILLSFRFVKLKLPLSTKNTNFIVKKTYIFLLRYGLRVVSLEKPMKKLLAYCFFVWRSKKPDFTYCFFCLKVFSLRNKRKKPYFTYFFCLKVILLRNNRKKPYFTYFFCL